MKLEAKDLRYGNKLFFLGEVVTFRNVSRFRKDGVFWIKTIESVIENKSFHFRPIQLTEDWLVRCGFEKTKEYFELFKNDEYFISYNVITQQLGIFINNTRGIRYWIDCKYVHKLQNLIYELEDIELTIKTE